MKIPQTNDTICALATPAGTGALAVIRLSGKDSFAIGNKIFHTKSGKENDFNSVRPYTIHFGDVLDEGTIIDEVLISVFRNPKSYTGEDSLEISCHGSIYIQQYILQLLQRCGARMAEPGEFTLRAFLNGKIDLSQAEAVSDLISSGHASAHKAALQQLRGGYSDLIKELRQQLLDFASLLELELDFAEEDVEFANRLQLEKLVAGLLNEVIRLKNSFATGNVLKLGIPVVIAGKPNVGKSTLLNALLNEEKAIVSEIAGTTRDVIEDQIILSGLRFRFIDTAGLRKTEDIIEKIGVEKSYQQAVKAEVLLYLCDPGQSTPQELQDELMDLKFQTGLNDNSIVLVINKVDQYETTIVNYDYNLLPRTVFISAKTHSHLDDLKKELITIANKLNDTGDAALVTNARHAEALSLAQAALSKVIEGIHHQLSTDLLALELKDALYHLGQITGEIYSDDLLGNIFSKFCIGK